MIRAVDLSEDFELLSGLLSNFPGHTTLQDINARFLAANHAAMNAMGFKDFDHMHGRFPYEMKSRLAEIHEQLVENHRFILEQNAATTSIISAYIANGDWRLFVMQQQPSLDTNKKIIGVATQAIDVTTTSIATHLAPLFLETNSQSGLNMLQGVYRYTTRDEEWNFSKRQGECFFWLLHKKSAVEIGEILGLTKRTVESYIRHIKAKFNVSTIAELIDFAHEHGLQNYIPKHWLNPLL
jgi:DNA-binding CsgD family transcriptional regulator